MARYLRILGPAAKVTAFADVINEEDGMINVLIVIGLFVSLVLIVDMFEESELADQDVE